jgi:hypothetical protein
MQAKINIQNHLPDLITSLNPVQMNRTVFNGNAAYSFQKRIFQEFHTHFISADEPYRIGGNILGYTQDALHQQKIFVSTGVGNIIYRFWFLNQTSTGPACNRIFQIRFNFTNMTSTINTSPFSWPTHSRSYGPYLDTGNDLCYLQAAPYQNTNGGKVIKTQGLFYFGHI